MERRLYRFVKSNPPAIEDFRSNADLGKILHSSDAEALRIHDGVSMWDERRLARKKARLSPALGQFVEEVTLPSDSDIRHERTFGFGHYPVWGTARDLAALVTAITPVDES